MVNITKKELVNDYIGRCEGVSAANNRESMSELVDEIVLTFEKNIPNIRNGLDRYDNVFIGRESDYKKDLQKLRAKLVNYLTDLGGGEAKSSPSIQITNVNNNALTNNVDVDITFKDTRDKINGMESLSYADTKIALEKLDELIAIAKSKDTKKVKWAKISSIFKWLCDKTADLAIAFMPAIFQSLNIL